MFQIVAGMSGEPVVIQALLMLGVCLNVYLFLVRPQLRRISAHALFVASLAPGDRVITGGGLVGRIERCDGALLTVTLADGVHVEALRDSVEPYPR